jgi:hypothetical protein
VKLIFSDLHGRPVSDFMIAIPLNQGSDSDVIISQAEIDIISL